MRAALGGRAGVVSVGSAGFAGPGMAPPAQAVRAMQAVGIDISGHRSRMVTPALLGETAIVVAMTRQHLVDLALLEPGSWRRMFTLADALRRGRSVGGRRPGEAIEAWVQRLDDGRSRADIVSLRLADDVRDPIGGRMRDFTAVRDALSQQVSQLAAQIVSA